MIFSGLKDLAAGIKLTGFTLNLVGLNFTGGFPYINKELNNV